MMLTMLLCASFATADEQLQLALDLFGEGDWDSCRRECRRVLISSPDLTEARVLAATCGLRLDRDVESNLYALEQIADDESARMEMRALAAYEAGREHWRAGELEPAYHRFTFAYLHSKSDAIFLRSGCSLFLLMKADKALRSKSASIYAQIRSTRDLYDWSLQKECIWSLAINYTKRGF